MLSQFIGKNGQLLSAFPARLLHKKLVSNMKYNLIKLMLTESMQIRLGIGLKFIVETFGVIFHKVTNALF